MVDTKVYMWKDLILVRCGLSGVYIRDDALFVALAMVWYTDGIISSLHHG